MFKNTIKQPTAAIKRITNILDKETLIIELLIKRLIDLEARVKELETK